jgi:hypothetical protein
VYTNTLTDKIGDIDRRQAQRIVYKFLQVSGRAALIIAAGVVYALFVVVSVEVMADAGVYDRLSTPATTMLDWAFQLPVIAAMGWAVGRLVNILTGIEVDPYRFGAAVAGGATVAIVSMVWLGVYGVI